MYELIQAAENSYYIQCPSKIGLVRLEGDEVCLIDSGSDKDAGRKVRQLLDANGWKLRAIYITHSHADHIGGCQYLQRQTGCRIYAPGIELAFTRAPILEPAFLWGGCPPKGLRHKFLMAQESDALPLTPDVLPEGWEAIGLPGHCFSMTGYRSPDGVVYLADCLSGRETLEKYRIGYLYDVGASLETLEAVAAMQGRLFIPSHAEAAEDIAPLARYNAEKIRETAADITALCAQPLSFDALLAKLFRFYGLTMTEQQHALLGSTLRSYLSWLQELGELEAGIEGHMLLWQRR